MPLQPDCSWVPEMLLFFNIPAQFLLCLLVRWWNGNFEVGILRKFYGCQGMFTGHNKQTADYADTKLRPRLHGLLRSRFFSLRIQPPLIREWEAAVFAGYRFLGCPFFGGSVAWRPKKRLRRRLPFTRVRTNLCTVPPCVNTGPADWTNFWTAKCASWGPAWGPRGGTVQIFVRAKICSDPCKRGQGHCLHGAVSFVSASVSMRLHLSFTRRWSSS